MSRTTAASVLLLAALAGPAAAQDVLIARDGAVRSGVLASCVREACVFGGARIPRAEIAWLGLGRGAGKPPVATQTAVDEIHLGTRRVIVAPVTGVSLGGVATGAGDQDRTEVAWIRFAGPAGSEPAPSIDPAPPVAGDQPDAFGAPGEGPAGGEEGTGETGDDVAEPPEPPTGEPQTSPPPTAGPEPGPPGASCGFWTGSIQLVASARMERALGPWELSWQTRMRVRLREQQTGGPHVALRSLGSIVHETYRSTLAGPGGSTCTGTGTTIHSDTWDASTIDLAAGGGFAYDLTLTPDDKYDVTCSYTNGDVLREKQSFQGIDIGDDADPEKPRRGRNDTLQGSYTAPWVEGGAEGTARVSWNLRRIVAPCDAPPAVPDEAPPEEDPCDPGDQASLRDNCYAQLELLRNEMEPHLAQYNELMSDASDVAAAFERADRECKIWDAVDTLLKAYLGGGAPGKALIYLADVLDKVQKGELHTLLYPDEAKQFLEYYKQVNDLYASVTDDQLTKMRKRLKSCAGKVGVDTEIAAEKFLGLLEAAKQVWESDVSPGLNELRSKGLECAGWDHKAWEACMQEAECRGVAADCGGEPSLDIE